MAQVKIYNLEGKEIESLELNDSVFGLPKNDDLVHQVFVSLTANQRQVLAHTKNRGDRAGSGIKPWAQKGTGRARVGSSRTPTWRGGGIAFGPRSDRNFSKKINKKMNAKAIATVLSGKLKDSELIIVEKMDLAEKKTKNMSAAMKKLNFKGRALIAFGDNELEMMRVTSNLPKVNNISVKKLNVLDMLNNKNLILSKESVRFLEEKYKKLAN
ncbi:MAG TPA: 50S ribosomal protein L4 [Candidatus Moranbacteria bacterium]|nr:50S ribosomal protein L4 [Candidatus Moranbacteria bacterium]